MNSPDFLKVFLFPKLGAERKWLDPIRIMKGLFLAQMEQDESEAGRVPLVNPPYQFIPYSYGPFCPSVYGELESLALNDEVEFQQIPGKDYRIWGLTDKGEQDAQELVASMGEDFRKRIEHARIIVCNKTFDDLIRYVYSRYPDYASKTIYRY